MLRFLSKDLTVETRIQVVAKDWYVVLMVACEEEVIASNDAIINEGAGSIGDVQSKNFPLTEQTSPNEQKVELDLVTTPLSRLSQWDLAKIQPRAYFSETNVW